MKLKKLISTALVAASLFTGAMSAMPLTASAAHSQHTAATALSTAAKDALALIANKYDFATAEDMLTAEQEAGYIDTFDMVLASGEAYALHINRFTGMMYYQNKTTGQILTSNPHETASAGGTLNDTNPLMQQFKSQIILQYSLNSDLTKITTINSYQLATKRYQVNVTPIESGFRVNYTIGDTTKRFLIPGRITYADFYEKIFSPIYNSLMELLDEHVGGDRAEYDFFEMGEINKQPVMIGTCYNTRAFQSYIITQRTGVLQKVISGIEDKDVAQEASTYQKVLMNLVQAYTVKNPFTITETTGWIDEGLLADMYKEFPITQGEDAEDYSDDVPILVLNDGTKDAPGTVTVANKRTYSQYIRQYCPDYSFAEMYADEELCGYDASEDQDETPVFRCSLEYRLDEDGTLLVSLPAGSITFDATQYTVRSISVLPYFGAGRVTDEEGYAFYPDGSGTIIEFNDFYNAQQKDNIQKNTAVFGDDYCYSNIAGQHKEQVTMPVYGIVNHVPANKTTVESFGLAEGATVTNGYFAIMEEGSSLSTLNINLEGTTYPYLGMYCSYTPYAIDSFDLSAMISSATSDLYYIMAETPYTGLYTQRFVMLRDPAINPTQDAYVSSYIGMAAYYRDYLESRGVLTALTEDDITSQMPLYIETLGSMEIDDTFLTFPIKKDIPLTSFEDIIEMYKDLYEMDIKNVNVRMTAFANGGMYSTYPVKLKWERACGGKSGLKTLIAYANGLNREDGEVLGLYPEFDFMYINYTSLFDGIGNKNNVSRMLDNRYANKRERSTSNNAMADSFRQIIAAEALDRLYGKFAKKYQKYDLTALSVSTMGSDLSSNFDEDAPVDREAQRQNVMNILKTMSESYSLMLDKGNAYTLEYADHILNLSIDSSHFRYSSYSVPFIGMILHGYVNYAGTALNNSGAPEYDILRSIENGASLYYLLCYQNIEHMKEYAVTNKYYSVDYHNWFDDMVSNYNKVNDAIGGDLQTYKITDHKLLIGERVVSDAEREEFYTILTEEYVALVEAQLLAAIDEQIALLQMQGGESALSVALDEDAILAQYLDELMLEAGDTRYVLDDAFKTEMVDGFKASIAAIEAKYSAMYPAADGAHVFTFASVDYQSQHSYLTESEATDGNHYQSTVYTNNNGNIVLVTYTNEHGDKEEFILNYNIFSVTVTIEGHTYTLNTYEFKNTKDKE